MNRRRRRQREIRPQGVMAACPKDNCSPGGWYPENVVHATVDNNGKVCEYVVCGRCGAKCFCIHGRFSRIPQR